MNINRRLFLKRGGIAMAVWGSGAFWAPGFLGRAALASSGDSSKRGKKVLVCIFQRGAADGLSMVIPHGDPFYYKHRQDIAIAQPSRTRSDPAAIDLDGFFGLHPAMDAFAPLYREGHLAVIHACGSPNPSRSHFDKQDWMESGVADARTADDGWMNRLLVARHASGKTSPFRAVAMSSVLPRSLQGQADVLAIRDLSTFGIQAGTSGNATAAGGFEGMYDSAVGDVLGGAGKESFDAISILKKADPGKYHPDKSARYPQGDFARALTQLAQLIKAQVGLETAFVEIDGWDTHVNQGGAGGQLAGRLHDFSQAIAAFHRDLGDRMEDVLVLTMTEFGRAVRQNGNRGTDHGHAGCFFVLGGNIRGGKVLGTWPGLAPEKLFEERDLAVTTDFRAVFAEACVRHIGVPIDAMDRVLPHYQVKPDSFPGFAPA